MTFPPGAIKHFALIFTSGNGPAKSIVYLSDLFCFYKSGVKKKPCKVHENLFSVLIMYA